jgi:hypothetical protein
MSDWINQRHVVSFIRARSQSNQRQLLLDRCQLGRRPRPRLLHLPSARAIGSPNRGLFPITRFSPVGPGPASDLSGLEHLQHSDKLQVGGDTGLTQGADVRVPRVRVSVVFLI